MALAFWILFIVLCVWVIVQAIRTGAVSVETFLIIALLFVLGAAQFGWPG
jgi:hypothetical protein